MGSWVCLADVVLGPVLAADRVGEGEEVPVRLAPRPAVGADAVEDHARGLAALDDAAHGHEDRPEVEARDLPDVAVAHLGQRRLLHGHHGRGRGSGIAAMSRTSGYSTAAVTRSRSAPRTVGCRSNGNPEAAKT